MTEKQLALVQVDPEVKLTDRQAFALEQLRAAGPDGLHADELGARVCERRGKHTRDERCSFDGSTGNELLRRLRKLGLARYRRGDGYGKPGYWVATTGQAEKQVTGMLGDDEPLPF